jgi:hypothetical protein
VVACIGHAVDGTLGHCCDLYAGVEYGVDDHTLLPDALMSLADSIGKGCSFECAEVGWRYWFGRTE